MVFLGGLWGAAGGWLARAGGLKGRGGGGGLLYRGGLHLAAQGQLLDMDFTRGRTHKMGLLDT